MIWVTANSRSCFSWLCTDSPSSATKNAISLIWVLAIWCHCMCLVLEVKYGLGAGGEGDNRGWDGWMASPTRWTWVWVNCGSWRWTWRPGVLQFMGSQRVGHDWVTERNWWCCKGQYCIGTWNVRSMNQGKLCQLQTGTYQEHCQRVNSKGLCHLPLRRLNPMLL